MLIGQLLGPFRVERELGAGAMGAVYLASFPPPAADAAPAVQKLARVIKPGQRVAVKVMAPGLGSTNPNAVRRFEREAAILKQMKHPHIVRVYAVGKERGTRYYAMELINGESLDKVMYRRGRLPWEEVVALGKQLCAALQHAHEQGIIHRDLKPSNLMILPDGTLKLTDFGIAKDLDVTQLTSANCTVGTAAYMSPEQCRGERDLTHKSDLYSLGIVFYELVTGVKPFQAENAMDMFMQHVQGKFERPARLVLDIPIWLDNLICQLMEKTPNHRPRDAGTVAMALQGIQEKVEAQHSAGVEIARSRAVDRAPGQAKPEMEDRTAALSLLGVKVRSRRKKKKPFYQKVWFQAVSLLVLLAGIGGLIYLAFRPASPESLYRRAEKLMASPSAEDHVKAMEGPIKEYLQHYETRPGEETAQLKKWADDYEVEQCEEKLEKHLQRKRKKLPYEPQDDLEKQAFESIDEEEKGDLARARQKWTALDSAGSHRWHLVASRHLEGLEGVERKKARLRDLHSAIERLGKVPQVGDPIEARAFAAYRCEEMGDLPRALKRYQELQEDLAGAAGPREWVLLAVGKAREIQERLDDNPAHKVDRAENIGKKLEQARELLGSPPAQLRKAQGICRDILDLYGKSDDDAKLPPLLKKARELLAQVCAELGEPPPS